MTASTAFFVASGLSAAFGIVYLPVLMRQPKAFVSPYAKADVRKRAAAAIADGLLVATCVVLFLTQDSLSWQWERVGVMRDAVHPGRYWQSVRSPRHQPVTAAGSRVQSAAHCILLVQA